ncbi:MAG TPA: hypothetical protein OIL76_08230 [Veillonellaceae bacterium]|nr:hypothetical protein [Veillonellaceae bacterium]
MLEKKVGNISWPGDAKMWYVNNAKEKKPDTWKGRMRIKVRGQVNDSTYVQGRFKNQMDFKGDNSSDTTMDWLYVNHSFGDANVTLGRMPVTIYDGFMFDSTLKGAKLAYGKDAFDVSLSFGRLVDNGWLYDSSTFDAVLAEAGYDFGAAKLRAAYVKLPGDKGKETAHFDNMWSTHLSIPVKDFQIFGEYWDSNAKKADKSWQAGLGYSNFSMKKPGSFDLNVAYNKVGYNANLDGTTYDTGEIWNGIAKDKTLTYWSVFGDVALMKNVSLHGEYAFDLDNQKDGFDDKAWTLALNYKY